MSPTLFPLSSGPFCLGVGDGGATAQFDDHLLTVVEGTFVSQLLQGASGVCQHSHPLARSRKKGGGKVATRQHHRLCLLALAWPHFTLVCIQQRFFINQGNSNELFYVINCVKAVWRLNTTRQTIL